MLYVTISNFFYSSPTSLKGSSPKSVLIIKYLHSQFAKNLLNWKTGAASLQEVLSDSLRLQCYQDKHGGGSSWLSWECAQLFIAAIRLYEGSPFYARCSSSPCGILTHHIQWKITEADVAVADWKSDHSCRMINTFHHYLRLNNYFINLSFCWLFYLAAWWNYTGWIEAVLTSKYRTLMLLNTSWLSKHFKSIKPQCFIHIFKSADSQLTTFGALGAQLTAESWLEDNRGTHPGDVTFTENLQGLQGNSANCRTCTLAFSMGPSPNPELFILVACESSPHEDSV